VKPEPVSARAVALAGLGGAASTPAVEAMARNLAIAERSDCLDADGHQAQRKGQAPKERQGPCAGGSSSVDYINSVKVAPGLAG
jgi:hypothetical protein